LSAELAQSKRENAQLVRRLEHAEAIIAIQKNGHGAPPPPVGIETVAVHWSRKGAAGNFLVASDPVKKHGPWVVADLRVVTPSGDPG
jgi:hypothetical protein